MSRIAELSPELLRALARLLDTDALLALEQTSGSLCAQLRDAVAARCKRECFGRFLHATISTHRMLAPVPETWRQLFRAFSSLEGMRWLASERDGVVAAASLRALRSDNHEYEADSDARFLLKSGGHYWFSVWQTRLQDVALAPEPHPMATSGDTGLAFLRSPRAIRVGKWEKIRASGQGPSPRRHHSMTVLADARCPERLLLADADADAGSEDACTSDRDVRMRRLLFFGGQSEGIPFDASNELFLLGVRHLDAEQAESDGKLLARWLPIEVTGQSPSRRCGHAATLLRPDLLLISGGSDGTASIEKLEVHVLRVEGVTAFRWSTVVASGTPSGRALHSVRRVSSSELFVFGGRQIRQSNALLGVLRLRVLDHDDVTDSQVHVEWSSPDLAGDVPHPRRGHSTNVIGDKLLLFGGQSLVTGALENDLRVLDVQNLRWRTLDVPGASPCPRRGFKSQYFGTSLVISGGFVESATTGKIDKQLADSDVHVLAIA